MKCWNLELGREAYNELLQANDSWPQLTTRDKDESRGGYVHLKTSPRFSQKLLHERDPIITVISQMR
jgi:hypothetical protein